MPLNLNILLHSRLALLTHLSPKWVRGAGVTGKRSSFVCSSGWLIYVLLFAWFVTLSLTPNCLGQDIDKAAGQTDAAAWRTGADLEQFIKSPVSVSWQYAELGPRLTQFSRSQKLAVVLDRRIDPNQLIDLTVRNVSVEQFLLRVAQASGGSFCRFGDCIYIGPVENARRLLAIDAILSSGSKKNRWSRTAAESWPRLSTPQEVITRWSQDNEFAINQLERIEHDLMSAVNIPPMRLDMRLALLLSQFDLWFRQNKTGTDVTIVDPPEKLKATLRLVGYDATKELLDRVRSAAPDAKVVKSRKMISVTGNAEELEFARNVIIESWQPELTELDKKRFQLKVKNERGQILNAVAQQLELEVLIAEDCKAMLKDVVAIEVKDATVTELLDAILTDTPCSFLFEGQILKIYRP